MQDEATFSACNYPRSPAGKMVFFTPCNESCIYQAFLIEMAGYRYVSHSTWWHYKKRKKKKETGLSLLFIWEISETEKNWEERSKRIVVFLKIVRLVSKSNDRIESLHTYLFTRLSSSIDYNIIVLLRIDHIHRSIKGQDSHLRKQILLKLQL